MYSANVKFDLINPDSASTRVQWGHVLVEHEYKSQPTVEATSGVEPASGQIPWGVRQCRCWRDITVGR